MLFLALAVFLSGCAPSGSRALLKGKKLLDRGDYAGAVAQLKIATSLLATNATAWNDYGVACQHAGQLADAAAAYQNALKFDRDLTEAHYNLGCLWLEQDKFADAKTEFTAYTLRRANAPEGWLKLGAAQLHAGDDLLAEKSFSTALSLNQNNAEALNGFGLARVAQRRPQDAARFFSAAIRFHPDYTPALLNLATVEHQYLRDDRAALENYRKYLALTPRPENWDAVNALAQNLEPSAALAAANPPPAGEAQIASSKSSIERPAAPEPPPVIAPVRPPAPRGGGGATAAAMRAPSETVRVQPAPAIVPANNSTAPPPEMANARSQPGGSASPPSPENYAATGVTPLPEAAAPPAVAPKPVKIVPPAPPVFPRYFYLSPRKPKPGDRKAAARAFAQAQQFEQKQELAAAADAYRQAAQLDPAWFEAQYNYGVLAGRQRDFEHSLAAYEMALALQPDSTDARYNFALELKAAGYATDAENELKKVLAAKPGEARAHLALANLYAEAMRDPARAREHYLKVLDLDPRNPQATNIRFWLSANPP